MEVIQPIFFLRKFFTENKIKDILKRDGFDGKTISNKLHKMTVQQIW